MLLPSVGVVGGSGAVGLSFATLIAHARAARVTVFARGRALETLRKHGLHLEHPRGKFLHAPADDSDHSVHVQELSQYKGDPFDVVLLCVKAHSIDQSLVRLLRPLLRDSTALVCAQNGLPFWYTQGCGGRLEGLELPALNPAAAPLLSTARVVGCVMYLAAWTHTTESGALTAVMPDPPRKIVVGAAAGGKLEAAAESVAKILTGAGLNAISTPDIRAAVWDKLVGNAIWNPMSALTLQPMGYLSYRPHTVALAESVGREVIAVAEASGGIKAGAIDVARRLELTRTSLAPEFKTSMLQDVEAGREPEVGPILSSVIEVADALGVEVPTLRVFEGLMLGRRDALVAADGPGAQDLGSLPSLQKRAKTDAAA